MRRLLPIVIPGFVIASLLIYLFGDSGLLAYRRLDDYRQSLAANVEKLQARNSSLSDDLTSLKENPQLNLVLAREIGLYRAGDEVVKLEGMASQASSYEVGDLIKLRRTRTSRNAIFKATGIGISGVLAVFAFLGVRGPRRKLHDSSRGRS